MLIDPDTVAAAFADTAQHMFSTASDGWLYRGAGVLAGATGAPLAMLNGIWAESSDPDPGTVAEMLDRLADSGLPHCMQLRPGSSDEIALKARSRAMAQQEKIPLMVLEDPTRLSTASQLDGLTIRELSPAEGALHVRIAAGAFGMPEELFARVVTPELLSLAGVHCYIGEVDGESVTTGMGVTLAQCVGIFNIATSSAHRGRGYGTAMTARVASDGLAEGVGWAWLQSSPAGYGVYERLGFRTIERWDCWVREV
ncbi:MAG: GNAT family N-acetyltransferase [Acidimicrobiales bacterium]|jgi:ribosomal protein S18 acetylase RimI-like enzyme